MTELDASYGEGGGQLVRTALALAALTGRALRLVNVRARRARPGLAPQHLAAVRALAALCDARCEDLELRATAFSFEPGAPVKGGELRVDVGTAGSVTLVLQALLPVLLRARTASRVAVSGGTDVRQAPTWDYFREVLLGLLARMRLRVSASVVRRGYYPRGGGEVVVEVEPGRPQPLVFSTQPESWDIGGDAHVAHLPLEIAERMRAAALAALPGPANIGARVLRPDKGLGTGGAITLWAHAEAGVAGASRVAERGVRAETLGAAVGAELAADIASGAHLDVHAADQILVYAALASGASRFSVREVSSHARTAMWLIGHFLPVRFTLEARDGSISIHTLPGGTETLPEPESAKE
jgi:RNA 3'-phosphate cyclase